VTATDVSKRSLWLAGLNAELNSAVADGPFAGRSLELVEGSLLEPVGGRRFDLVVSNPPYVVTPRRTPGPPTYSYRDAGLVGDQVVQRLVENVATVLDPGGTAQLLGSWEHHRGVPWQERVGEWLDRSGLHGWVVQREVQDPAEYAETWARDGGHQPGTPEYEAMYDAWLEDFAQRDVEALGFGVVTLRRPRHAVPARLARLEEHAGPVAASLGAAVAAALAAQEWLLGRGDADLLAARLRTAADVTEERFGRPGAEDPEVIQLRQGGGLQRTARVDTALAGVVGGCDGELALGAIVRAVAELTGESEAALTQRVVPAARRLVADGFLNVAS
jgi:hypothetical protein